VTQAAGPDDQDIGVLVEGVELRVHGQGCVSERCGLHRIEAVRGDEVARRRHDTERALANAGMSIGDIDLVEINEAFAAQVVPSYQDLGIDIDRLNVNGGAIAVGHPFGMTGARLQNTMLNKPRLARQDHRPDHHVRRRRDGHGTHPRTDVRGPSAATAAVRREEGLARCEPLLVDVRGLTGDERHRQTTARPLSSQDEAATP
jgi:hypothetical protein